MLLYEYCEVTHFMAGRISALYASQLVYREFKVAVLSGADDFEDDREGGDSFAILGLVKENPNVLFHTKMIWLFQKHIKQRRRRWYGGS